MKKCLCSFALLLGLLSCSKREDFQPRHTPYKSLVDIHLFFEEEPGSPISVNQDFLKDFQVIDLGGTLTPEVRQYNGQGYIEIDAWAYPKEDIGLHDGDTITSNLRIYKGKSRINVTCYYQWTNLAERSGRGGLMYGGAGFTLVKMSYNGKSYEERGGGLILPLIWSQGKLQVK